MSQKYIVVHSNEINTERYPGRVGSRAQMFRETTKHRQSRADTELCP